MKKITFVGMLIDRSMPFLLMLSIMIGSRLFGQLLSYYSDYTFFGPIIWFFSPIGSLNPLWGIAMMIISYVALIYIEYQFNKINNLID